MDILTERATDNRDEQDFYLVSVYDSSYRFVVKSWEKREGLLSVVILMEVLVE